VPESEILRPRGEVSPVKKRVLAIYGRVSAPDQRAKGDLDRQVARIRTSIAGETFAEIVVITDVASGLSDKRRGLVQLMDMAREGRITDLAIAYKDRLTRFGCTHSLNCVVDSVSVRCRGHGEARARQRAATRVEWA
jgi:predicted site-specific integrase-resolvase